MQAIVKFAVVTSLVPLLVVSFRSDFGIAPHESVSIAAEARSRTATIRFVPASNPPAGNQSAPRTGRSRGGASRGNCPSTPQSILALVPTTANQAALSTLTVADRPTFWFYVPYALSAERPAEFTLLNDAGEYLYQTQITQPTPSGGILQITLPDSVSALAVGKTYNWTFQVLCEAGSPIDIWGSLERVSLTSGQQTQLQQIRSPQNRAAFYAENGIWYDALTQMANWYAANRTNPEAIANWTSFLQSAGLDAIAAEPMINCCR